MGSNPDKAAYELRTYHYDVRLPGIAGHGRGRYPDDAHANPAKTPYNSPMAKTKKPRKPYRGRDAAQLPQVIRVEAPERNRWQQWWVDHKQTVIIRLVQLVLALLIILLVRLVWSLFD